MLYDYGEPGRVNTLDPVDRTHTVTAGLTGWWKGLDGLDGTRLLPNIVTNSYADAGQLNGTQTNSPPGYQWVGTPFGPGLKFDGGTGYADLGGAAKYSPGVTFAAFAWIKPNVLNSYQILFGKDSDTLGRDWMFGFGYGSGQLVFYDVPTNCTIQPPAVLTGEWQHVGFIQKNNAVTIYCNGVAIGSGTNSRVGSSGGVGGNLLLGRRAYSGFNQSYNGCIADPMVWMGTAPNAWDVYQSSLNQSERDPRLRKVRSTLRGTAAILSSSSFFRRGLYLRAGSRGVM